jgi:hypothetical protein
MAGKYGMKDGTEYLPKYNWEIGMNDELQNADRAGWQTSVEMLTGGKPMEWDDLGGLEVGPTSYEHDPMGEDRTMMTFSSGEPRAVGKIGMMEMESSAPMQEGATRTSGGKSVNLSTPQTYNKIDAYKK